jgi:hypothetical protein
VLKVSGKAVEVRETRHGAVICADVSADVEMCIEVVLKPKRPGVDIEKLKRVYVAGAYLGIASMLHSQEMISRAMEMMQRALQEEEESEQ